MRQKYKYHIKNKKSADYERYRVRYFKERKRGNTKNGVKVLSRKQYYEAREYYRLTDKQILNAQTILHSKEQEKKTWKIYKKLRENFKRGDTYTIAGTYEGLEGVSEETKDILESEYSELGYHYNLKGLLEDKMALHLIISFRIISGEEREEVLADYGY